MKHVVIGLGEVGSALYRVLSEKVECYGYDMADDVTSLPMVDVLHICFGWSAEFEAEVKRWVDEFGGECHVIVHSTVPIGTCRRIGAVHSPVLGDHTDMQKSLKTFKKWFGGRIHYEVLREMTGIFWVQTTAMPETTEALKLFCLAKYGVDIAMANFQRNVMESMDMPTDVIVEWDEAYNQGLRDVGRSDKQRPIITNPDGKIGGHCVLPGTRMLDSLFENPMLKEVLALDPLHVMEPK